MHQDQGFRGASRAGLLALLVAVAACKRAPTAEQLKPRLEAAIKQAVPAAVVTDDGPGSLLVALSNGTSLHVSTDNLERTCAGGSAACEEALGQFGENVARVAARPADSDEPPKRENVRFTLKDTTYVENARRTMREKSPPEKLESNTVVAKPFLGDLWLMLTDEHPTYRSYVTKGTLATLGMQEKELFDLAQKAVDASFAIDAKPEALEPGSPVLVVRSDDAAGWVACPARWKPVAQHVSGQLLVSIPNADLVLIAGSEPPSSIAALRAATARLESGNAHPVSKTILRWAPGGWTVSEAAH